MVDKIRFGRKPIETNMLCFARPDENEESGFRLILVDQKFKWWMNDTDICVATVPVEYFAPDDMSREELILKAVESLRDKQKQVMAEAQLKYEQLQKKINDMLLLTDQRARDDNVIDIQRTGTDNVDDEILF